MGSSNPTTKRTSDIVHEDVQVTCCHRRASHEIVLGPGNLDGICEADRLDKSGCTPKITRISLNIILFTAIYEFASYFKPGFEDYCLAFTSCLNILPPIIIGLPGPGNKYQCKNA